MKKGCFFGTIIFLTLAIGIGFYLYKKYFPEIKSYGKKKIVELSINEVNKKVAEIKNSPYKDSLKIYLKNRVEKYAASGYKDSLHEFGRMIDQVKDFIKDGEIDSVEFNVLKSMVKENERPEKN